MKYSVGIDFVEGGEVEQAVRLGMLRLSEHIRQSAFPGRDHQPAPTAVAEAFFVGFALQIGQARQDLLAVETRVVFRAAVDLQQVADAVLAGGEHEETIRANISVERFILISVADFVRVGPELALRESSSPGRSRYHGGRPGACQDENR